MPVESPPRRSPSIREIARIAGVAPSTVSRALNTDHNGASVDAKTRARVSAVCRRLNYFPNAHATRLFAGRSNAVALVVPAWGRVVPDGPSFSDPNLAKTLAGLTEAAAARHQELVLLSADEQFIESRKYLRVLRNRSVDGLLVWGAPRSEDETFVDEVAKDGWPVVLINSFTQASNVPTVQFDNRGGSMSLASRLVEAGHRRIGYITGPGGSNAVIERLAGFETVCREAGAELLVRPAPYRLEAAQEVAAALLDLDAPPTAIAATNDLMAIGAIEAAMARGLQVPRDLSVTGGDGTFPYHRPRLETFRAPMEEIGRRGLALLLERVARGKPVANDPPEHVTLPIEHITGDTVAPPSSA